MSKHACISILLALLLSGCASTPNVFHQSQTPSISLETAINDIEIYTGNRVRWGGTILSVKNHPEDTWVEILQQDLNYWGRPQPDSESQGRYYMRVEGFLDPELYKQGKAITSVGLIESTVEQKIGDHTYAYPVIYAESADQKIWKELPRRDVIYYDSFYHPFYRHSLHRRLSWRRYW